MLAVIAGTNRPASNTLKVAHAVREILHNHGEEVVLLDLAELPPDLMAGSSYADKPEGFAKFQETILAARGFLTVVPEYNGSFPGILKYFIDMLRFPESLYEKPSAFIGISAGRWGATRAVDHLEAVFHYRHGHLFGRRVFIPAIGTVLDPDGRIIDPEIARRVEEMTVQFCSFCNRLDVRDSEESHSG
jgi:NAD(P)H-dependent FMN reductase